MLSAISIRSKERKKFEWECTIQFSFFLVSILVAIFDSFFKKKMRQLKASIENDATRDNSLLSVSPRFLNICIELKWIDVWKQSEKEREEEEEKKKRRKKRGIDSNAS